MEIFIRTLCESDYHAIVDLITNELGYQGLSVDNTYKRLSLIQDHEDYETFVAVLGNQVIGFIGLFKGIAFNFEGEYIQIIALAVRKEHQNIGVGTKLLIKAEEYAMHINGNSISLNSGIHRVEAHEFYQHRGYIKEDTKSYFRKSLLKN